MGKGIVLSGGSGTRLLPTVGQERKASLTIGMAFAVVLALQIYLVFTKSINWDEFFHFQIINEIRDDTFNRAFQTLYIRAFTWLPELPFDPIDQLLIGRLVIFLCTPVTAFAIYALANQFTDRRIALLCALTYLTAGYVFLHVFAFRADAPATALLMLALWLYSTRRLSYGISALIALLLAIAALITIKSVLYAPAFLGLFYLRLQRSDHAERIVCKSIVILALAALFFAALYLWHTSSFAVQPIEPVSSGQRQLASAGKVVFSAGLFPQAKFLIEQVFLAPLFSILFIASVLIWRRRLASSPQIVAMVGLMLPVATILFYRNAFPYYYVFILAPAAVTIFPAIEHLVKRVGVLLPALLLVAQAIALTVREPMSVLAAQRSVTSAVHQMFPQPVTYVDLSGMVAGYPRVFPFLTSGWGLRNYRDRGQPLLQQRLTREPVPLLIDNDSVIHAAITGKVHVDQFLPDDARLLREDYVQHWGPVWVAGKKIPAGSRPIAADVAMGGIYTLEGAAVIIDGRRVRPGETVRLRRGRHAIAPDPVQNAVLRWGDHLPVPNVPAPNALLFTVY